MTSNKCARKKDLLVEQVLFEIRKIELLPYPCE